MEIRIVLNRVEPPNGRLRVVHGGDPAVGSDNHWIRFTGWLWLLRALSEVTGSARP